MQAYLFLLLVLNVAVIAFVFLYFLHFHFPVQFTPHHSVYDVEYQKVLSIVSMMSSIKKCFPYTTQEKVVDL